MLPQAATSSARRLLCRCHGQLLFQRQQHSSTNQLAVARSFMYVPASSEKMVSGLGKRQLPDMIVLDCEDGVAYSAKAAAREAARRIVADGSLKSLRRTVAVRVNASRTELAEEDVRCVLDAGQLPDALVLPKVESADDLAWLEAQLLGRTDRALSVIAMIESVSALLDMRTILAVAEFASFTVRGVVFGSDDFCSSLGVERTRDGVETLTARSQFAMVARSAGLLAIDKVEIDYKDAEYFRQQCRQGRQLGFTGKQIIHPAQLSACHEEFSPTRAKVAWAEQLCREFEQHSGSGTGAFVFKGQMIDMPTVRVARNILQQHLAISELEAASTATTISS